MSQLDFSVPFEYLCLRVYDRHKYFYYYSAAIDFRRQNLTSVDIRFLILLAVHEFPVEIFQGASLPELSHSALQ